ncbi:MAG TPA: FmdB family zinc ribbon protein [Solirubrobacteraceae bacterium]|nr:FmdB family zinc ribbon protein [Solirubrobacteraceae bacterium]
MPIYEYRRPDGSTFELVQSFSDEPLTADPETGDPVQRVLHAPAVHFKGKGFYNTDYGTRKRQREGSSAGDNGSTASDKGASDKGASESSASDSSAGKSDTSAKEPSAGKPADKPAAAPAAA